MKYKLTIGKHTRFEKGRAVRYVTGDVFEPTDAELVTIGDRLEPVIEKVEEDSRDVDNEPENTGEGDQLPVGDQDLEGQRAIGGPLPAGMVFIIGEEPQADIIQPPAAGEEAPAEQQPEPEPKTKRQPRKKSED